MSYLKSGDSGLTVKGDRPQRRAPKPELTEKEKTAKQKERGMRKLNKEIDKAFPGRDYAKYTEELAKFVEIKNKRLAIDEKRIHRDKPLLNALEKWEFLKRVGLLKKVTGKRAGGYYYVIGRFTEYPASFYYSVKAIADIKKYKIKPEGEYVSIKDVDGRETLVLAKKLEKEKELYRSAVSV